MDNYLIIFSGNKDGDFFRLFIVHKIKQETVSSCNKGDGGVMCFVILCQLSIFKIN